jgi:protein-tyrosine-phosphatase
VFELAAQVSQPMNLVSYHLNVLRSAGFVHMRRSDADGRDVYYSLDFGQLRAQFSAAGRALHPSFAAAADPPQRQTLPAPRVLFICTHNSARSQMAEALLRQFIEDPGAVASAGHQPTSVHPDAIRAMDALGINIRNQQAKPLSAVEGVAFDYAITLCDRAHEVCPAYSVTRALHWGYPDPTAISDPETRARAFTEIADSLQTRLVYFLMALPTSCD